MLTRMSAGNNNTHPKVDHTVAVDELRNAFPPSDYETSAFKELMARGDLLTSDVEYDDIPSDKVDDREVKCIIREVIKGGESETAPLDVLNSIVPQCIDKSKSERSTRTTEAETRPSDDEEGEEAFDDVVVVREVRKEKDYGGLAYLTVGEVNKLNEYDAPRDIEGGDYTHADSPRKGYGAFVDALT